LLGVSKIIPKENRTLKKKGQPVPNLYRLFMKIFIVLPTLHKIHSNAINYKVNDFFFILFSHVSDIKDSNPNKKTMYYFKYCWKTLFRKSSIGILLCFLGDNNARTSAAPWFGFYKGI